MHSVSGSHIVVTGAASGIGLATAQLLHKQGAKLTLWDVKPELTQMTGSLGDTAVVDVSQPTQVERALAKSVAQHGTINGVIHAAGIIYTGMFATLSAQQQTNLVTVNLTGSIHVAQVAIPYLQQSQGSLILFSSTSAFYGTPEFATYSATKAGVLGLAQALRLELEPDKVHVGVVCPFFVDTPMIEAGQKTRLFKRFGVNHTPAEVAQATVQKGLQQRNFMIWVSLYPAFFHWLGHIGYPFSHHLMRLFWGRPK